MRKPPKASAEQYRQRILAAVFRFLFETGVSEETLRSDVNKALLASVGGRRCYRPHMRLQISDAGCILHRWHNDTQYLGKEAKPIPLRIRGRNPSLESLVRAEKITIPIRKVAEEMRTLNLIRKTTVGFLPTRSDAIVGYLSPTTVQYAASAVSRMLATITNNISANISADRGPILIERAAFVPDFPKDKLPDFSKFVQTQGETLATSVNDWLESRRTASRAGKRIKKVNAGLHVYAFSAPSAKP
jgi:hypothetical protein